MIEFEIEASFLRLKDAALVPHLTATNKLFLSSLKRKLLVLRMTDIVVHPINNEK